MRGGGKGNGHTKEKRSGFDRRITGEATYRGPERRKHFRRRDDRAPDKPIKR